MSGALHLDVVDRVALLTIDRPAKRNAMTRGMWESLLRHVRWLDESREVVAVVVRGAGGSFSAGADLAEMRASDPAAVAGYRALAEAAVLALMQLRLPKIAQIEGPCFGAGCSVALACDIRICSPASLFGIPALANGFRYEPAFVRRLAQIVGTGAAGLLLYGGERWDAPEAATRGLVEVCADDAPAAVERMLTSLRAADPIAVAATATAIRTAPQRA